MSATVNVVFGVIAVGAVIAIAVFKAKLAAVIAVIAERGPESEYKAKAMLSANELEFLNRLESAVPEYRICPQVAMGAVLNPNVPRNDKAYMRLRGKFAQKIIDFVAQDRKDGSIVAIIELDDRTHTVEKDENRDAMLLSAGYKIVRWQSKNKPDAASIRSQLIPPVAPTSPPTSPK